jgi:flagellar motor switch protein FliG
MNFLSKNFNEESMKSRVTGFLMALIFFQASFFSSGLELEKKKMERDLEDRITGEIQRYFPDLNFLVTAEVTLVDLTPAKPTTDQRDLMLPGVSGFQAENPQAQTSTQPQYGIESIVIRMLIDKNRSQEDKDLLQNIAFYTGRLNKVRGDRVDIQEMSFPPNALQVQREQLKAEQDKRIQELEQQKQDADQKAKQQLQPQESFWNPTTIILLGLGLLILILLIALLMRAKTRQQMELTAQSGNDRLAQQPLLNAAENSPSQPSTEEMQEFSDGLEVSKIRSTLVATCAGESELTASVIRDMVADQTQKENLVVIISQLGNSVLQVMRDYFSIEEIKLLQEYTMSKPEKNASEIKDALIYFQNQLTIKRFSDARNSKKNPFAFLERLSEPQLYLLMKDEPPGIIAIILSQLTTPVASSMLKSLPSMQQGEVALELGKLRRLTSDTYVSVAKQLAAKAATIPVINNVQVQGTDLLLDIFDNLDETSENSIIEFIKVVNLDLFREITSQRVSFNAIAQLDDRMLRQLVKDISGDEIAIALKNAPPETSERILSVLPSKARQILEDRMASMRTVSPDDELKARRRITRMIRQYLKSGSAGLPTTQEELGTAEATEQQA